MNKFEPGQEQIVDKRKRCHTCDTILPQHKRWCVAPVIAGEKTQEPMEVEGQRSLVIEEYDNG